MKKFLILYTAEMSAEHHFDELSPETVQEMNKAWTGLMSNN